MNVNKNVLYKRIIAMKMFIFNFKKRTFIYEHNFYNSVKWDVNLVRAHAILPAIRRPVVAIAKLFGVYIVVLTDKWCRWGHVRYFIY